MCRRGPGRPRGGAVAKDRWHQALDRLADQLFGRPAEHPLDRPIREDHRPTRIRRNDALRGGLEQRPERAVVFLVATRLESLLGPAAFGDVQFQAGEPRDVAGSVAIGSSQAVHPSFGSIRAQDTVCVIPRVLRPQNLFEGAPHRRTVLDVHTCEPRIKQRGFFRREPELRAEGVIPVGFIRAEVPCPGAASRGFEGEPEPRALLPQRRFGTGAVDGVPGPLGDVANELDLAGRPHARRVVIDAERGHHLPILEARHADQRRDVERPQPRAVGIAEPVIRLHIADDDGFAAPESLAQRAPHSDSQGNSDERLGAASVLAANDVLAPPPSSA